MVRRLFPTVLLAATSLACTTPAPPIARGGVVPFDTLYAERADLPALVEKKLSDDARGEAFYVTEFEKTRTYAAWRLLAQRSRLTGETVTTAVTPEVTLPKAAASDDGTRGVKLPRANTSYLELVASVQASYERVFWEDQRVLDARLKALDEQSLYVGPTLKGSYLVMADEEVSRSLSPDEALLSYFVTRDAVWVWAFTRNGHQSVKLDSTPAEVRRLATEMLTAARDPTSGDAWRELARGLYDALVAPVEDHIRAADAILISPHAFIANVPFAALLDDDELIVDRFTVSYLPSATYYRLAKTRPLSSVAPRMLVVGNADYPRPWSPLPMAEDEARTVSYLYRGGRLLTGASATERRFYELHRGYNIFHFATHGLLGEGTNLPSASLVMTPGDGHDGYLTAVEIQQLELDQSYLVVLSACETSLSATGGDSNLASITNAFLAAGVPTVIGSQWQVADESTAALMLGFYRSFLEVGSARAMQRAQQELKAEPQWSHPFFWAAFVVHGWNQ